MFGTKWPSMMSTWTQSDPHSLKTDSTASPRAEKSADRMLGAMIAGGAIADQVNGLAEARRCCTDGRLGSIPKRLWVIV
jgi:hypothetical protein